MPDRRKTFCETAFRAEGLARAYFWVPDIKSNNGRAPDFLSEENVYTYTADTIRSINNYCVGA